MAVFHASDLSAYSRCAASYGYRRAGLPDRTNSGTAYGSVMHLSLQRFELAVAEGLTRAEAERQAIDTFRHYWNPDHIEAVCDPVPADGWLPGRSYGELVSKGPETIRAYSEMTKGSEAQLLALEFSFAVPIPGTWDFDLNEPHVLRGTLDKLSIKRFNRVPAVLIEDHKTGVKVPKYLRHHSQFSAYSLASTLPSFWTGWLGEDGFGEERGNELYERCKPLGRNNVWIDLHQMKFHKAGWRGPIDYARVALAIEQLHHAITVENYPLSLSGEHCQFCAYRAICGGGLPDASHGAPNK